MRAHTSSQRTLRVEQCSGTNSPSSFWIVYANVNANLNANRTRIEREKVYDIVIASGASHQADNLAKLWHEHLSVLELIAQILGAVSNAISQVWLTLLRQTRNIVATTMTFA